MKIPQRNVLKKIVNIASAGILGLYALTQCDAWISQGHGKKESSVRTQFREQFGFPIYGLKKDIEENLENVSVISDALEKNRESYPFTLRNIAIQPESFFKRTCFQQIRSFLNHVADYNYG